MDEKNFSFIKRIFGEYASATISKHDKRDYDKGIALQSFKIGLAE